MARKGTPLQMTAKDLGCETNFLELPDLESVSYGWGWYWYLCDNDLDLTPFVSDEERSTPLRHEEVQQFIEAYEMGFRDAQGKYEDHS